MRWKNRKVFDGINAHVGPRRISLNVRMTMPARWLCKRSPLRNTGSRERHWRILMEKGSVTCLSPKMCVFIFLAIRSIVCRTGLIHWAAFAEIPTHRALLIALEQWVLKGTSPPDSKYRVIADGTLMKPDKKGLGWHSRRICCRAVTKVAHGLESEGFLLDEDA